MRWAGRPGRLALALGVLALGVLALSGCDRGFFHASGTVASEGDRIDTWRAAPQGCTRDPFDGQPVAETSSILTLLWQNPGLRDPKIDNTSTAPDAPLRMGFSRVGKGPVVGRLQTKRHAGLPLDASDCGKLSLELQEQAARGAEARPSLAGHLVLECELKTGRVTADVRFAGCQF